MVTVQALQDFPGASINREALGIVRKGDLIEVSENDAQYLVREGYAERFVAAEETPVESTPPAEEPTVEPTIPPAETPPVEATTGPGT